MVDINKINPAPYNPRRWEQAQEDNLRKSIERFGVVDPLIVNNAKGRKDIVIGGHFRLKIAKELGYKEVPVVYVNIPDVEKEKELNLRLNANLGEWDFDLLKAFDIDMLKDVGFDMKALDEIFKPEARADDDVVPEPPKEPISKLGDIYQLGRHRVMCGDSTKKEDVEQLMDGKKVRIVVTSPPYANQREYSKFNSYEDYLMFLDKIIKNFESIHMPDFIVFWNIGSSESTNNFIPADNYFQFLQHGYKWIEWIIWNKESATWTIPRSQHIENGLYIPALRWESCIVFSKGNRPYFDIQDKDEIRGWQENVWNMNKVIGSTQQKTGHPAMFPVELPYRAVKSYSQKEEYVYDSFLGSGSTLIACEKTNRICYGMEIDPIYVDVIIKRYCDYVGADETTIRESRHGA